MFERWYLWAMRYGSRLLFAAACLMLFAGFVSFATNVVVWSTGRWPDRDVVTLAAAFLYSQFAPAAYLLFGALVIERLRPNTKGS